MEYEGKTRDDTLLSNTFRAQTPSDLLKTSQKERKKERKKENKERKKHLLTPKILLEETLLELTVRGINEEDW